MENKVHFKLHKVKKQWVTIAVSGLALGASLIGVSVSADEQAANQVTSASTPESVSQDPDLVVTETTVATTKADQVATNSATDTTAKPATPKYVDGQKELPNTGTEANASLAALGLLGALGGFGLLARKKKED